MMLAWLVARFKSLLWQIIVRAGDPQYSHLSQPPPPGVPRRSPALQLRAYNAFIRSPDCLPPLSLGEVPLTYDPRVALTTKLAHISHSEAGESVDDNVEQELSLVPSNHSPNPTFCCSISRELAALGVTAVNDWLVPPGVQFPHLGGAFLLEFYRQRQTEVLVCSPLRWVLVYA